MHNLLVGLGVIALGLGAASCSVASSGTSVTSSSSPGTPTSATVPPADTTPLSPTQIMNAALAHGGAQPSLHYVSTSLVQGLTTTIVGDVNQTSGTQTIVVSHGTEKATIVIELVGHEAYFRGSAAAIELLIGLSAPVAAAAADQWVSVVPSDSVYKSTAAALTVDSVMSELTLAPPVTRVSTTVLDGRALVVISGGWIGDGITAKEHATGKLEIINSATPLPLRFSGVAPATASSSRFAETLIVGRWGEPVHVTPPASSVPLATVTKSVTTTTQPPTVV